ncbi:PGN_0703 family putative restriction endonuclease [Sinorhizobium fredii]|uniref:PGN_0703 family putative restriction endonuclease n=1 Tax=Rhizobium fredii TaxID=380 RepID=UPI0035196844
MNTFVRAQRESQSKFFADSEPGHGGYRGSAYRLDPVSFERNLAPSIRSVVPAYFTHKGIQWHTHSNHGLSSQVCCLNFLAPLAREPEMLARLVQAALGGEKPTMRPVEEGPDGEWFVGFEWIGGDYLNESGKTGFRSRGANATSADAVLMFERDGKRETLLIEWKYTESYGAPISANGNATRLKRYEKLAFYPDGPIRADLGLALEDFFWEPFYQLLRQQMLAFQMEKARENGADIVRVLHLSPAGNSALKAVTAPKLREYGSDFAAVWQKLLQFPDRFKSLDISSAFEPILQIAGGTEWAAYVTSRYSNLFSAPTQSQMPT